MPVEVFSDLASTVISSGGTDAPAGGTVETLTAASPAGFPSADSGASPPTQFHIADTAAGKDTELIAVTLTSGGTWTATRGAEGTTPVTHSAGWTAQIVLTAAGLSGFLQSASNLSDVASPSTARTSLGLGSAATQPSSAFDAAGAAASAQAAAEAASVPVGAVGAASGVASLDSGGHVPVAQLPAATAGAQGAVELAGDLGGTASSPQVTSTHLSAALPVAQGGTGSTVRNFAGLLTPAAVKTSAYTASAGDFVPCDTTSGGFTVTLPDAPADLTVVAVKMVTQGGANAVIVACAGSDVLNKAGGTATVTLGLLNQGLILQYKASGGIWYVLSDDLPLAALDSRYLLLPSGTPSAGAVPVAQGTGTATAWSTAVLMDETGGLIS